MATPCPWPNAQAKSPELPSRTLTVNYRPQSSSSIRRQSLTRLASPSLNRQSTSQHVNASSTPESASKLPCRLSQSCRVANVKRWDGFRRNTATWDSLRRDPELWFPSGDCLVHLHGRGQSRRGPSFRLRLDAVRLARCLPLLEHYSVKTVPESTTAADSDSDSQTGDIPCRYELWIPPPPHSDRHEIFRYHLNTRNFFAWMFSKPLVGARLGETLVSLLERMKLFRGDREDNMQDLLDYMDRQGYSRLQDCPDHALASLFFAERIESRDLWIDAFAHCVGMNDRLAASSEFQPISRDAKAFIIRAKLEMDIRLEHTGQRLGNFLDAELSKAYLGLGSEARDHLDRFRSFLFSFYVCKYGYWPPAEQKLAFSAKARYRSMYVDFRNLYRYLVDERASSFRENTLLSTGGGLCVLQNITAFDKRNGYSSLEHLLPLIPDDHSLKTASRVSLSTTSSGTRLFGRSLTRSFGRGLQQDKTASVAALRIATNTYEPEVIDDPLVRAYRQFEEKCTLHEEDKISIAEARKVRWILIYAVFQSLISVTRAPPEVRDVDINASYHLCCQVPTTLPWKPAGRPGGLDMHPIKQELDGSVISDENTEARIEIRPDTDLSFAFKTSVTRDLTVKHPQPRRSGFHEILVHGYGNGLNFVKLYSSPSDSVSETSLEASVQAAGTRESSRWSTTDQTSSSSSSSSSDDEDSSKSTTEEGLPDMDHTSVTGTSTEGSVARSDSDTSTNSLNVGRSGSNSEDVIVAAMRLKRQSMFQPPPTSEEDWDRERETAARRKSLKRSSMNF